MEYFCKIYARNHAGKQSVQNLCGGVCDAVQEFKEILQSLNEKEGRDSV